MEPGGRRPVMAPRRPIATSYSASRDVVSGAVGFRYELARKFGMHAGLDVGFSEGTTAIYIQVGNAWFRP